ncbi:hypothetical protein PHYPSEUDO_009719 [Phytophthora pseudosyringae]|uniref:HMG box domain-containing protein n=1 Tax=Phytophthora pseudosyringae TaxID=221518 RepID=A0A8T1VEY8_9STRA|nr:hypothetical protein PHYPSEUDO_009719 [Phytophthora pseudosyringae]
MPLPAIYGAVYATASSSTPAGKIDSGKKAMRHLENLPLLVASDSLESMSKEGKWLPRFMRRAVVRSVANRIAGLILVGTSAFLASCIATLVKDDAFKLPAVETMFWRSLVSWLLTLAAIATTGTKMRVKKEFHRPLALRCVTGCIAMTLTIIVLENLAVSNATAITYFSPLLAFAMAAFFLKEKPGGFTVACSVLCVAGAVLIVRPAFLFGKNGSTDAKWYHRSMTSFVTSYLFGESLAMGCAVVVLFMQAGVYVSLRSLQKVPYLVVMHYFLLSTTVVSLAAMLGVQHGKFKVGASLGTWGAIAGTGALAFAEQLFLTRGFQFDGAGVLAATLLLHVGFEFAWSVILLGAALNPWSAGGAGATAAGVLFLGLRRVHTHWAARRSMRRMGVQAPSNMFLQNLPPPQLQLKIDQGMEAAAPSSKRPRELVPDKSAYLHYSRSRREALASVHPSWSVQQVSSELGRQWKSLTAADRKPWVELAQFDKARFHTEAHQYIHQQQANEQPVQLRVKRKKQPNEPRQPDTAYICFWKSRRSEVVAANPLLEAQLVSKEMARQWRALSDSERRVWEDMAAKDKLRFQEEIAHFHPTLTATPDVPPALKAPLKDPFAPKPAKTGFQLFMSHNRESFTLLNMTISEFRTEMSQLWKRLSDADKNEWYELAKQDEQRYEREMNAYKPPAYMDSEVQRAHKRIDELKRLTRGDPSAPRLPRNAYNVYLATERQEMAVQRPDLKNPQIMREIGIAWKALSDDERAQYQRKAEEDVERFRAEMEVHLARQQEEQQVCDRPAKRRTRKRQEQRGSEDQQRQDQEQGVAALHEEVIGPVVGRKKRKAGPPRRPKTAYNLMYMSKRTELLATYQMSHNECSALCGRLWRQMSEEEREPYKRMAAEDKRRYEVELEMYNAQANKDNERALRNSAGFRHFFEAKRRENENLSRSEATAIWLDMSKPHQLLWTELANDNDSTSGVRQAAAEEQQQLEASARMMLATRERPL